MTAYPGIAPPIYSHGCLIALVLSLGMLWETAFGGVPLSPSVISVCWEQDCPRQCLLAVWIFFVRPWTFLLPRHGLWAWYEMDRDCQILWPHNSPSKSCCLALRERRRILMSSGLCHGRLSLVPCECQSLFACPRHSLLVTQADTWSN